ncbi:VanZ family protein [Enterococcus alishanensis]|uniref:VanZ family protein n=1 Tax=Enterococcus alishanensis TaxID=1303817 RepID=A0ABS6T9L1_9ENTE|nr:VanZ family protein [Enterococcus alishanensis]MBV7389588.1 VanZ family protein [Enterococcus alishanensis]
MFLEILFTLYQIFCIFLPCLIYQWIYLRKNIDPIPLSRLVWRYIFIFYLYLVINITGVGTLWDILSYPEIIRIDEISLVPFQASSLMTNILNAFMFMPLGFLLPLIWKKYRQWFTSTSLAFGFSLMIELLQLFNRRVTDINDLMMNTLGAFLGFLMWRGGQCLINQESKEIMAFNKHEAASYIFLSLIGTFFLYNWRFFLRFL